MLQGRFDPTLYDLRVIVMLVAPQRLTGLVVSLETRITLLDYLPLTFAIRPQMSMSQRVIVAGGPDVGRYIIIGLFRCCGVCGLIRCCSRIGTTPKPHTYGRQQSEKILFHDNLLFFNGEQERQKKEPSGTYSGKETSARFFRTHFLSTRTVAGILL